MLKKNVADKKERTGAVLDDEDVGYLVKWPVQLHFERMLYSY
jgi:hypothetical protein